MAVMIHRTTFSLDEETITRIKRLALVWGVSQAEAVRRAAKLAEKDATQTAEAPLLELAAYHQKGGLEEATARAYIAEVSRDREDWGRST
jgi:hypothetical protein